MTILKYIYVFAGVIFLTTALPAYAEDATTPSLQEHPLAARVVADQQGNRFTYTLVNDEAEGSQQYVTVWGIRPHATFSVISMPEGWHCETDNTTYMDCANTDAALPYPHDAPPGASLRFVIESEVETAQPGSFTIVAWDHEKDTNGMAVHGHTPAPFDASMPEDVD